MKCKHQDDCKFYENEGIETLRVTEFMGKPPEYWAELYLLVESKGLDRDNMIHEIIQAKERAQDAERELKAIKMAIEDFASKKLISRM